MGEDEGLAHDDSLSVLALDIDDDLAPGALGFDGGMGIRAAVESVKTKGSIRGTRRQPKQRTRPGFQC